MTTTGKVFKAYAAAVVDAHGFGSNKMVRRGSPEFIGTEEMRAQRLIDRGAVEEGTHIFREIGEAYKWLMSNGYLREYVAMYEKSHGRRYGFKTNVGLTAKGWAVARKYLDAEN